MSRRVHSASVPLLLRAAIVGAALGLAATARAHELPDVNLRGETGLIELSRGQVMRTGHLAFGAWVNYFRDSGRQGMRASPVSFSFGLPLRSDLALGVANVAGDDPLFRESSVQFSATLKRQLLVQRPHWVSLAAALRAEDLAAAPRLTPQLLAERRFGTTIVAAGLGFRFATDAWRASALTFGAGVEHPIRPWLAAQAETTGHYGSRDGPGLTFAAAVRLRIHGPLGIVVGAAAGLFGEADVRVFAGLRFRPTRLRHEDEDQDGIPDYKDGCVEEPEDKDGFNDFDGCPDLDNDGDGIPDKLDPTPDGEGNDDLHSGPARLAMAIPAQPIPVWIMEQAREERLALRIPLRLGETVELQIPVRLPTWVEDAR